MVAGVGEVAGEPVDDLGLDRRQRDQHAGGTGGLEHLLGLVDAPEHGAPATDADVVGADESDDPVPEARRPLGRVQQADGVGVGADDEDRPADLTGAAQPEEDPPGDRALDDEQQRDEHQQRDDPQPGQRLELQRERDGDDHADADERGVDDPAELLGRPLDGPGLVQLVERERHDPDREREEGQHQVGRWTPSSWPDRISDCHTKARTIPSPTTIASTAISRCFSVAGATRWLTSIGSADGGSTSAVARPPVMLPAVFNFRPSSMGC